MTEIFCIVDDFCKTLPINFETQLGVKMLLKHDSAQEKSHLKRF